MARTHVIHPAADQRDTLTQPLLEQGWQVIESFGRSDALQRLAGPNGQRWGDLIFVDLSAWSVPGTALIRALRRQVGCVLPIAVRLPAARDAADLAGHAARMAGANLLLPAEASPMAIAAGAASLAGYAQEGQFSRVQRDAQMIRVWQEQLELLALPDHAAATVVSARRVFEALLSQREDARGGEAALALTAIAGGPVPLSRWAGWYHPAQEGFADAMELTRRREAVMPLCLLFDAGGQRYALPLDAGIAPGCWWTDGGARPPQADGHLAALPLVRLLGSSGFRRLLCTDRATVLLRRQDGAAPAELAMRVDEVMGIEPLELEPCPHHTRLASGCQATAVDRDGEAVLVLDGPHLWRTLEAAAAHVVR